VKSSPELIGQIESICGLDPLHNDLDKGLALEILPMTAGYGKSEAGIV